MNCTVRIGAVPYLNARPLVWALARERAERYHISYRVPTELAKALAAGEVDVALLPAFEYLRGVGNAIVPDVSISCRGAAGSVKLFSHVPVAQVERLATDASSATSAALAQVLLGQRHGADFAVESMSPDLAAMLAAADAAVLIGDLALVSSDPDVEVVCDLGQEWYNWQHLPFTFALWVANVGVTPDVGRDLLWAKRQGLTNLGQIVAEGSRETGLDAALIHDYLEHNLDYDFTEAHLEGLRAFARLCLAQGLLHDERDLNFLRSG